MPKLVVLDMAGTSVVGDDAVARAVHHVLVDAGLRLTLHDVVPLMGRPLVEVIRATLERHGREADAGNDGYVGQLRARCVGRLTIHYATATGPLAVPGVEGLLTRLQEAEIPVMLDTGFCHTVAVAILRKLLWLERRLVRGVITANDVREGRPSPDSILQAMAQTRVQDAAAVAKVGDTPHDLLAGTRARCGRVIGVTWGSHTRAALAGHPHTHLVDTVEELAEALGV